jgi:hypothetical protein
LSAGSQKGIAVLAPGIVAFLPTERTTYLLGEMALTINTFRLPHNRDL